MPAAELPTTFSWAVTISHAFAEEASVVEHIGSEMLSPQVQALVADFLHTWQGAPAPLSRTWVQQAVAGLPEAEQAADIVSPM